MSAETQLNSSSLKTLKDVLDFGVDAFEQANLHYGHGTDNAWDEALALALYVLQIPYETDPKILDDMLSDKHKQAILDLFQQRIETKIPAAYITNKAYFAGLEFYVDERVLIPRSPFAELIDHAFSPWIDVAKVDRALDLCTGSACIAIAMANYFPEMTVDAVDISKDALEVAKKNLQQHALSSRVKLIESDLFDELPKNNQYQLIVSNPPYVSSDEMQTLPDEYGHEPVLGLEAGPDGLVLVDRILNEAADYLSDDGVLIVEVGNSAEAVIEKYPKLPLIWIEFARGGEGVFTITAQDLRKYYNK